MKHIIPLKIKTSTKVVYQVLMIFGLLLILAGLGLAFVAPPLLFFVVLGLIIFLATYFTVKEVNAEEVQLIIEVNAEQLLVYRENNRGYQAAKTILKPAELSSMKVIVLKGSFGINYYCIEVRTKAKGPMNHKIVKLLSPLLEANESEILNILAIIQRQYPTIQLGH